MIATTFLNAHAMDSLDALQTMNHYQLPSASGGAQGLMAVESLALPHTTLDVLEHAGFDTEHYTTRSEDAPHRQYMVPPKSYPATTFDDAFSDALSAFDPPLPEEISTLDGQANERDHKLLSFGPSMQPYHLVDYAMRQTSINITAQLHGMFFLAETSALTTGDAAAKELTCYRRNLFQVTGTIAMSPALRCVVTETGEQLPIVAQELAISANETVEGNPVKIISVPWKSPPAAGGAQAEDKQEKEPGSVKIDLTSAQNVDGSGFVSVPLAWKRLQFRMATANNGRRKELQQHFVVRLKIIATLANGSRVCICEARSGNIIVRGRSPRNFQSRNDMPISGSGAFSRGRSHQAQRAEAKAAPAATNAEEEKYQPPLDMDVASQLSFVFGATDNHLAISGAEMFDWKIPTGQAGTLTALPHGFSMGPAMESAYPHSSPDLGRYAATPRMHHTTTAPAQTKAPINLSLVDDEARSSGNVSNLSTPKTAKLPLKNSLSPSNEPGGPVKRIKSSSGAAVPVVSPPTTANPPQFSINAMNAADESADMLYEYFPLGLDDWMPPVDAVYRPHVVHHTNLPADPKMIKERGKRYFSEVP